MIPIALQEKSEQGPECEEPKKEEEHQRGEDNSRNSEIENHRRILMNSSSMKREKEIKEGPPQELMSVSRFFWTSISLPCNCKKSYKSKENQAVVNTVNKYLENLVSVETLIDSRILLNKMKAVLFNDDQLHLINNMPINEYENFYTQFYGENDDSLFIPSAKACKNKSSFLYLRREFSIQDKEKHLAVRKIEESQLNAIKIKK
mmetsp:Transcript_16104/g.16703  ORF Transcript_16104/g.16703 Transcript_16104/m.16703 type:complete len:204 (+) Transcript_16104:2-613(+)